ncbi:MAG: M20/M25/M40 family metallo-hydrolase, partial [Anaerolineae bacterium]
MDEVEFLRELLEIYSPSGQESPLAHYLVDRMQRLGFTASIDPMGNVIGQLQGENSTSLLVLLGHMDTVPGFIPIRLEDGRLYGRGAVDAKGALATFIIAAARAASSLRNTDIVVIGAVEEEADSKGARYIVDKLKPDYAIIGEPSGWDSITLGYKGSLHLDYRLSRPAKHNAADGPLATEEAISFWNRLVAWANEVNQGKKR